MEIRCKVLIVDDELLIRKGIINCIDWNMQGFQIVGEASNGKEALQLIKHLHPHVVITDIVMPIIDGIELINIIKKDFPNIEVIVLSSFEDFEYVRSTFQSGVADYILKPKLNGEEFLITLKRVVEKIPELRNIKKCDEDPILVEEMIESMILTHESAYSKSLLKDHFPNDSFILLAIQSKYKEENSHLILNTIINDFKKYSTNIPYFSVLKNETSITLLLNFDDAQLSDIKQFVNKRSKEYTNITWLMSPPFKHLKEMKHIYEQSLLRLQQYLFYLPDQTVFIYDSLPQVKNTNQRFNLNHFIDVFKNKQFKKAFQYLTDFVNDYSTQYHNDSFEFKSFLGNIIFNIIVLMENLKFDSNGLDEKKYQYFTDINEAKDVHFAVSQFTEFLNEASSILFSNSAVTNRSNIQKLLDYIEEHYTEPLRLTDIADHFHFNASYLSSYFNNNHNEGFSEYLNRVRIKKSMDLLKNSTFSISTISERVGYSDHSYYCKVFKKTTGISPSKFRREYQGEQNYPKIITDNSRQ